MNTEGKTISGIAIPLIRPYSASASPLSAPYFISPAGISIFSIAESAVLRAEFAVQGTAIGRADLISPFSLVTG